MMHLSEMRVSDQSQTKARRHLRQVSNLAMALALGFASSAAYAQEAQPAQNEATGNQSREGGSSFGEPIIVTATKRAENLQDVSLSIAAISGDLIKERGFERLSQVAAFIPNVAIGQSDEPARTINMRGLGSGNNRGFETSVGLFLDGAYLGRELFLTDAFFDVARIEAIKGPQGALFGKNTIAGAISVITNQPTTTPEAEVTVLGGSQNRKQIDAYVSGPLTDTLSARVYGQYLDRDGFYFNTFTNKNVGGREVGSVRGKLRWEPTKGFDATLTVSYTNNKQKGYGIQPGPSKACVELIDPNAPANANGCAPGTIANLFSNFGTLSAVDLAKTLDPRADGIANKYVSYDADVVDERENMFVGLNANWTIGTHTLTYNGSWAKINNSRTVLDADHGPYNINLLDNREDYTQNQHELRLTSPAKGFIEYIAGVYYFHSEIDGKQNLTINQPFPGPPQGTVVGTVKQKTDTYSVFGQATINVSKSLRLIGGLRYTDEQKKADSVQTRDPTLFIFPSYTVHPKFKDNAFLVNGAVEYDLTPHIMSYASYTQGFKAGGINFYSLEGNNFTFGSESSDGYEVGLKTTLPGLGTLNLAAFYTKFNDLQTSTLIGNSLAIANAATAISKGIEAEASFKLTKNLSTRLAAAYLHARYDKFPNAPCTDRQRINAVGLCTQDLSGGELDYAPKYTGAWNVTLVTPLPNFIGDITWAGDMTWSSKYFPFNSGVNDPLQRAAGFVKFDARISLDSHDRKWGIAFQAQNITNHKNPTTISGIFQFPGSNLWNLAPLRQWSVSGVYRF